ncbi:MAG TPA: hypothetical protein VJ717_07495 [Gemmatimonadaceae bacterium]|nr:hypothetical protein [Gemmatimonadaceae bacterium]
MRTLILGLSLTTLSLTACEQREAPARVSSVDQITSAVPDSAMKQRWRDAADKGQLPPLDSLPSAGRRVTVRTPAQIADTQRTPARPTIRQGVVATVRPFSRTPVEQYAGVFTITNATANSLTGTLTGRQEPLELHFKLPDTAQLVPIAPNAQHRLRLRDEVDNQSLRREIILSSNDRVPLLVYISDGGARPYTRRFDDIPLSITQRAPGRDSVALVTVTLGGASTTLRPGQRGRLTVGGAPIGVFLENSYWTPSDRVETAEGDAYHVTLMLYRLRTPGAPGG